MDKVFKALVVSELDKGQFVREVKERNVSDLPEGDVLIEVKYSSLNYKDALSASGNKGVTRNYPHTPGIDSAGVVLESSDERFQPGEEVIVTGHELGVSIAGGYGELIRVPADWVVKLPEGLTLKESMIYGTAGFTAAVSVLKLMNHGVKPEDGEILVTGATGGVGSVAVSLLAREGYHVVAATGKMEEREFLLNLGAKKVIDRSEAQDKTSKGLLKAHWAGVVDTVGGDILTTAIKSTKHSGVVTCCGNAASPTMDMTVFPFILRGVSLLGVDVVYTPMETRKEIWNKFAGNWKLEHLEALTTEITVSQLELRIVQMLNGKVKGRTIVKVA